MIGNVALDVFIGMVFVFLLYSLLATIVQEIISSFLNLRAAVLVKAIRIMLNDKKPLDLKNSSVIGKVWERFLFTLQMQWHHIACRLPDASLAKAFYKHPSIKYLSPNSLRSKPSYIEPENFSATVIQMLRGKDYDGSVPQMLAIYKTLYPLLSATQQRTQTAEVEVGQTNPMTAVIQPETLDHLRQLYIDSQKDINAFAISLENWYSQTMDRATGWYKRQTRRVLFFIGLIIACSGNVDTIKIYHILSKDKTAREQMVQLAAQSQQNYAAAVEAIRNRNPEQPPLTESQSTNLLTTRNPILDSALQVVKSDIDQSNNVMAMGWHTSAGYKQYDSLLKRKKRLQLQLEKDTANRALLLELKNTSRSIQTLEPTVYDKFDGIRSLVGWLITALALTLGAPFWFDLLTKFMSLRSAGAKPSASNEKTEVPSPATVSADKLLAAQNKDTAFATTDTTQPEIVTDEAADSSIAQG